MANQRALIDIEMLLDVRHSTVLRMMGEEDIDGVPVEGIAEILAGTEYYRYRQHDNFEKATDGFVTWEAYQKAFAERNGDTIFWARMTDFVYQIRMDIKKELPALERGVEFDALDIYVNFYPYDDLSQDERDIIVKCMQHYMPLPTRVFGAYVPWKDLTVKRFENQFEMSALYDVEDWLKHHQTELLQNKIPENTIMTSRISPLGKDPAPEKGVNDPFACRSGVLQEWVSLIHVPTPWVCYNRAMFQAIRNHQYSERTPPGDPLQEPAPPGEGQSLPSGHGAG